MIFSFILLPSKYHWCTQDHSLTHSYMLTHTYKKANAYAHIHIYIYIFKHSHIDLVCFFFFWRSLSAPPLSAISLSHWICLVSRKWIHILLNTIKNCSIDAPGWPAASASTMRRLCRTAMSSLFTFAMTAFLATLSKSSKFSLHRCVCGCISFGMHVCECV